MKMTSVVIIPVRDVVCKSHLKALSDVVECQKSRKSWECNSIGYPVLP